MSLPGRLLSHIQFLKNPIFDRTTPLRLLSNDQISQKTLLQISIISIYLLFCELRTFWRAKGKTFKSSDVTTNPIVKKDKIFVLECISVSPSVCRYVHLCLLWFPKKLKIYHPLVKVFDQEFLHFISGLS